MNIFFDLDGTLLNASRRLYELFQELVQESELTQQAYWQYKRSQTGHAEMLRALWQYDDVRIAGFQKEWMAQIEADVWLDRDALHEGVKGFLEHMQTKHSLYVVTARQSEEKVHRQLHRLGIHSCFADILVTLQRTEKEELIRSSGAVLSSADWMIGDTGKDIMAGRTLQIQTAAVLSGFRNREVLAGYQPDLILNNVLEIEKHL